MKILTLLKVQTSKYNSSSFDLGLSKIYEKQSLKLKNLSNGCNRVLKKKYVFWAKDLYLFNARTVHLAPDVSHFPN